MEAEHYYCPNCTGTYEWRYIGDIAAHDASGHKEVRDVYQCPNCRALCFDWEKDSPCAGCHDPGCLRCGKSENCPR